jgi:CRP/FNR family transcriptional regulator
MIPSDSFRDWVHRYDLWRGFVFDLLSQRLASVMAIVEEVAFRRMDTRLAAFLAGRSSRQNPIAVTHQEIAAELGTAREVVSRILEDFAGQGLIRATRGAIEILDLEELRRRGSA